MLVALTGGIASGKSTVARRLAELGAVVVDADRIAREVVEPGTPALARIAERFGPAVVGTDGGLDRAALGAIVFGDEAARRDLNAITHPAVGERSRALFAAARAADPRAVVVYDVPLLVDERGEGRADEFDRVIVVAADEETRVRRLVELRGMDEAEARRRIASQAPESARLAIADDVVDANGSLGDTLAQVDELWATLRRVGGAA
ncbi:dephospho-CoA kinase [Protaetiibacter mangrovi]|uniref:Dephospho-CoA kinase n=1 Tax=Protaetiibacter mangrovi TaxID=2970926 RepID=A0ABT1ZC09_9MICO|nr:dephospho-CoA kinase [Protaetiibacter mangrovi]MCS0498240.1 dephospho-CoA kinase [Protaetiibacter mangrovi]TPX03529.1 dephospho-CoA kinase [Schumannella luteola]